MHRIRAITLDLDDTLWAIEPVIRNAESALWRWLAENYPEIPATFSAGDVVTLREEVIEKYWQKSHDFVYLRKKLLETVAVAAGYSVDIVDPAYAVFDAARNQVEIFPDVIPALEAIGQAYTVIAVTNGNASLEKIGVRHLFHDVVTAARAGSAKPAAAIFHEAVRRADVTAREVLHVGDQPEIDVAGAQDAGLRAAWINRHGSEWPEHLDEPDAIVESMTDLKKLLFAASL